eukprot:3127286-Rhodomonas_salina.1
MPERRGGAEGDSVPLYRPRCARSGSVCSSVCPEGVCLSVGPHRATCLCVCLEGVCVSVCPTSLSLSLSRQRPRGALPVFLS